MIIVTLKQVQTKRDTQIVFQKGMVNPEAKRIDILRYLAFRTIAMNTISSNFLI